MPESIQLHFLTPTYATTQGAAAAGLALESSPTGYNQIINQCGSLFCTRKFLHGFSSPQVSVPMLGLKSFECLDTYHEDTRFLYPYYNELIETMLSDGYYVFYSGVDDFYLPRKSWYNVRHLHHDGIIHGFDKKDKTYSIAAYDEKWRFSSLKIPMEAFDRGFLSSLNDHAYGYFIAYKMKPTSIGLDQKMILDYTKRFLSETSEKYPPDSDGAVTGIAVYDFIAIYLDMLKNKSIAFEKMDWRALRPVWEHTKCMYDRLLAIEAANSWTDELSREYMPLVEHADKQRIMYAVYRSNNRESLAEKIKDAIICLKEKERNILNRLVKKMEESDALDTNKGEAS